MALRRIRRTTVKRTRRFARKPRYTRRRYTGYRRFKPFRYGRKQSALRRAGNYVKYTARNNVNGIMIWPIADTPAKAGSPVTSTQYVLAIRNILSGNRQFDRNLRDYAWIKFNYVAVKVTDLCHIPYDQILVRTDVQPNVILSVGVNALCGTVPINVNWDVEQDFEFTSGKEGVVDPEGFAQHPGTKQFRPGQKHPVSFVWKFPKPWRQFIKTDTVKNDMAVDSFIADSMASWTGIKNIRAPRRFWISIPQFWGNLFPSNTDTGVAIRTYTRLMVYLGVTFRGRRLMDDGTCGPTSCGFTVPVDMELKPEE